VFLPGDQRAQFLVTLPPPVTLFQCFPRYGRKRFPAREGNAEIITY